MPAQQDSTWEAFKKKAKSSLKDSFETTAEKYKKAAEERIAETAKQAEENEYKPVPLGEGGPGTESVESMYPDTDFSAVRHGSSLPAKLSMSLADRGLREVEYGAFQSGTGFFGNKDIPATRSRLLAMKYSANENPVLFRKSRSR